MSGHPPTPTIPPGAPLRERILDRCRALGFAAAGVAPAAPTRYADELRAWLDAGKHGSMAYLAEHVGARLDPARVLPGVRSVIMVADLYHARSSPPDGPAPSPLHGRVARYARGRDYHTAIKCRLHALADELRASFPGQAFRAAVDTAPILEREYAARAGLGWVGKHTLLIHPRLGSFTLLGGVLTTLEIPGEPAPEPDRCGSCTRCIDACPTGAITPYSVDASRCIAYLTIERRGPVDPAFHAPIGDWIFGCDVCQDVCPHNSARPPSVDVGEPNPDYTPRRAGFDALEVLGWTEDARRAAFEGSALKRATLTMMKRNALIVLGNALARRPDASALERIRRASADESEPELVRDTARAVLSRLERP